MKEEERIKYKCFDCGNIMMIRKKSHEDARFYQECGCGEELRPYDMKDLETMNIKNRE